LKVGEEIILFNGNGEEVLVNITEIGKGIVEYKVLDRIETKEKKRYSILYCAVLKKENFELIVQKATEVGIDKIVPVITKRTVKLGLKMDRLQKIVEEASEQCGRSIIPMVSYPLEFHEAVQIAKENDANIFYDMSGVTRDMGSVIEKKVGIFVGPEGGWSEEELDFVKTIDSFKIISLGDSIMRAETAAIIASYLVNI
jgi:16S rRNA (uracil1498-N3)-methyltransferase